ncbi:oviduct-specific glycoprotein [Perognathus longimembris pacificus]|uniref:oviduct-specific glycoprotein n=1 Tax=Perognathus longimembris pacificus TaxID=214514 RepID=UPI002018AF3A|nr:oviduct-specific glycoprotein [Perognathus longimembris pacificus]
MGKLFLWVGECGSSSNVSPGDTRLRLVLLLKHHNGAAYKLVCYFTNWAHSRPGPASIWPHDLDPFLCTHLIFAFASMDDNCIVASNLQDEKILYPEFNQLKAKNRELKTLLSVGGWNFGTSRFTVMLSTSANRSKFIASVISLLRTHGFDGLDLFFLYPGLRGSPISDRWTFLFLIEELLFAFKKEALLTNRPRLLLSAAVSGVPHIVQTSYDVYRMGQLLDFISVLSYDLHGSWEKFTGHNSPLFSFPEDPKSSAYAMNYWRKLSAPPEKLIMGFPTYGRTFRLLKASENGLHAAAMGPGTSGQYTKQAGFLAYYEVCYFIQKAKKYWIDYQYVPYACKGKEWVGYDDATSFSYKAKFIKREHFGGAMVWTLDMDDVRGTFCGTGPFPLVHVLKDLLVKADLSTTSLPQFQYSSAMKVSRSGSERLAVTKALTTDTNILPPGGEAVAMAGNGKNENTTPVPGDRSVTPGRDTTLFGKHTVAFRGKTEASRAKTVTPVTHATETSAGTMGALVPPQTVTLAEKSHLSASSGGMNGVPMTLQVKTLSGKTMAPKMSLSLLSEMSVTPDEQNSLQSEQFGFKDSN